MKNKFKNYSLKVIYLVIVIIILLVPSSTGLIKNENNFSVQTIFDKETNEVFSKLSTISDIKITDVNGGMNLAITLKNKGNQDYRNMLIKVEIKHGLIFTPRINNYTIPLLSSEGSSNTYTFQTQILGFGLGLITEKPHISIVINEDDKELVIGTIEARIIGFKVKVLNSILNEENIYQGYNLFTPEYTKNTCLVNNKGEIIHQWNGKYIQGMDVALLENGNIIRADSSYPPSPRLLAGGFTGHIGVYNQNGLCTWEFTYSNSDHCLHHAFEVLPNGNILMIAVEYRSAEEAIKSGRNPKKLKYERLCPDHIIEVKPTGSSGGEIVWEWHVWDHLIQDYDPDKDNYGKIRKHPELIDINYGKDNADLTHINAIDYNEEFDQILLSVREFNEIWVIDHSTTTKEAANHSGGKYGNGGDLLYRWGNPAAYNAGTEDQQKLFALHDASWIEEDCPGSGNILIFNNQVPLVDENNPNLRAYSSVVEIDPPVNVDGSYNKIGLKFGPITPVWTYTSDDVYDFYSSYLSSAQRLPNGNTLICEGNKGRFFEINMDKEIVWQYTNNYGIPNHVFKVHRYGSDYEGVKNLLEK
ncbi:MAG: aryl-sulfate sulfotransferase [Candidatus Thermoplasmatota archaeon]